MNKAILNTEIQEFIDTHISSDITSLLLKGTSFPLVKTNEIIEQIEAKKRSEKKLPTWFQTKNIYYPNKVNIEQTSSEITAEYKANLNTGKSIVDITAGLGVDCYYFSRQFKKVIHCEIDKTLSNIAEHNYKQLGNKNISTINSDGLKYLKSSTELFDWIYIDPSRRHDSKGKVFFLNDCLPNVPEHIDFLFNHTDKLMIKTSPLLDISVGMSELKYVKMIHVIAVNNEVKELLWELDKEFKRDVTIKTANIKNEATDYFSFLLEAEKQAESLYHTPLTYLYEPNSAILKSGGFNSIANKLNLYKLHKHTHLYTNESLINFPGRSFKIEKIIPYNKKAIKKESLFKANITIRNFPESVQQIRKKFNIQEGGNIYLFFITDSKNNKVIIITEKLN